MNFKTVLVSVKGMESFSSSCSMVTKSTNNLALKSMVADENLRYDLRNS